MLSKFFKHGSGGGSGPVDYLLGKNRMRDGATVIHGDPEMMVQLIDSLQGQKHKYTSGVLSFSEHIPEDEKALAIQAYEKLLTAEGAVEASILWVEHTDKNRTELNFVVANVDLKSGRTFTPYVDSIDFGVRSALDEFLNVHTSDADPKDPARKRLHGSAHDYITQTKDRKELIDSIDTHVESLSKDLIQAGGTWRREDTKNALKELGFTISREPKGSLSVSHPELSKNIRLKGAFYESDSRINASYFKENERASEEYYGSADSRAETAINQFHERMQKRTERVRERFEHSQIKCAQEQQNHFDVHSIAEPGIVDSTVSDSVLHTTSDLRRTSFDEPEQTAETTNPRVREQSINDAKRRYWELHSSTDWDKRQLFLQDWTTEGLQARIIPCYFKDSTKLLGKLEDHGHKLTAIEFRSAKAAAFNIVSESKAKNWSSIQFSGSDEFVRHAITYAVQNGIRVKPKNPEQTKILKKVKTDDRARKDAYRAIKEADSTGQQLEFSNDGVTDDSKRLNEISRELEQQQQELVEESTDLECAIKRLKALIQEKDQGQEKLHEEPKEITLG
jgi:hypothetical protein